jgi:hypothetical protein
MENKKLILIIVVMCYLGSNLSIWIMDCHTEECWLWSVGITVGVTVVMGMLYKYLDYYEKVIKPL